MARSNANPGFGCKLQIGDGGVGAGTQASRTIGVSNSQLILKAKIAGTAGNAKTCSIVVSGNNTPLSVAVTEGNCVITSETDGSAAAVSTINDIIAKLYTDAEFVLYWEATSGAGDGTGVLAAAAANAALTGGALGTEVFTDLAEIVDVPGIGGTHLTADVTHMSSDGWVEQIKIGLKEAKPFTLPMNFVADDSVQRDIFETRFESEDENNYRVLFTDDSETYIEFPALVTDIDITHAQRNKAEISVQFTPAAGYTWSA